MRILELQEYAKENGFDSVEFEFFNLNGDCIKGKFIDAYFGFFRLENMADNEMMSVSQWRQIAGDLFEFHPIIK